MKVRGAKLIGVVSTLLTAAYLIIAILTVASAGAVAAPVSIVNYEKAVVFIEKAEIRTSKTGNPYGFLLVRAEREVDGVKFEDVVPLFSFSEAINARIKAGQVKLGKHEVITKTGAKGFATVVYLK